MPSSLISSQKLKDMEEHARRAPSGCFVEIGVFQGGSAEVLYQVTEERGVRLHLFDTFTGMPYQGPEDYHKVGDFKDCSLEAVRAAVPKAEFHVGIFPVTLPPDLEPISFIHYDADQYQGAKDVKTYLWDLLVPGGMIFIDDFEHLRPVGKAFQEDFPGLPTRTTHGQYVIVKP